MTLGLPPGAVRLVEPDPAWSDAFDERRARIARALQDLDATIEHIGSTSIPGLVAKPVIDVMIGVGPTHHPSDVKPPLLAIGLNCLDEHGIPGRWFLHDGPPRTTNIHAVARGSELWNRHIGFRNLLRTDDGWRDRYAELKRELAAKHPEDVDAYSDAKSDFIRAAEAEARRRADQAT